MGYMKKFKCPTCATTSFVVKQRKRGKSIVYLCKTCKKYFSVNTHWIDRKGLLSDHLDRISFRTLGVKYGVSHMRACRICEEELTKLPNNNQFTHTYCNRFSKTFLFDGKYFNVVNGNSNPHWVLLWGIDYLRHDIPFSL